MTDQQWLDECAENWHIEAAILEADGWQRVKPSADDSGWPVGIHCWIKDGAKVELRRELGSSNWYRKVTE